LRGPRKSCRGIVYRASSCPGTSESRAGVLLSPRRAIASLGRKKVNEKRRFAADRKRRNQPNF
jgi:hypothetical protein